MLFSSPEQALTPLSSTGPRLAAPGIVDIVLTCLTAEPKSIHARQKNPIDSVGLRAAPVSYPPAAGADGCKWPWPQNLAGERLSLCAGVLREQCWPIDGSGWFTGQGR